MQISTKKAINARLRILLKHLEQEIKHSSGIYEAGGTIHEPAPYCKGRAELARELYEYVSSMMLPERAEDT